jgi:MFS family permease
VSSYHANIKLLTWLNAGRLFNTLLPFYLIYAQHFGLSFLQVFMTQVAFAITLLLLEIPLGIFADLFGRKRSLVIGAIFAVIGSSYFLFYPKYFGFILGEMSFAVSYAAFSGSDTSLLYESCVRMQQQDRYLQKEATFQSFGRFAEALGGILGGFAATLSIILPAITGWVATISVLGLVPFLEESKQKSSSGFMDTLTAKLYHRWNAITLYLSNKQHKKIIYLIIYSALISAVTINSFWLFQAFLKSYHFNYILIGILWFVYHSASGVTSRYAPKFIMRIPKKVIFIFLPLSLQVMAMILAFTHSGYFVAILLLAAIAFGIKMPFIYNLLHIEVTDDIRASIISLDSLTTRIFFSLLAIALGITLDHYAINTAFILLSIPNLLALGMALLI